MSSLPHHNAVPDLAPGDRIDTEPGLARIHRTLRGLGSECLDILAIAAGWKPVAVVGYAEASSMLADVSSCVAEAGLETAVVTAWTTEGEFAGVPDWYRDCVVQHRARTTLLAIARDEDDLSPFIGDEPALAPELEASLLGYPACCTEHHRDWRRRFHRRAAAATVATANGDLTRAYRLASANWQPPAAAMGDLLHAEVAPRTGIVMCPACASDDGSPAHMLDARYAALARVIDRRYAA